MVMKRILLDYVPTAPDLALLPALNESEIRQRNNETDYKETNESYPLNLAEADRIADFCWNAARVAE